MESSKEKKDHDALKGVAHKILLSMGFKEEEITEEYWLETRHWIGSQEHEREGNKKIRVDIAGISDERAVAIECGSVSGEKIAALRMFFDDVIFLPYFTINCEKESYERIITQQKLKIDEVEQSLKEKQNEIWKLQTTISELPEAIVGGLLFSLETSRLRIPFQLEGFLNSWKKRYLQSSKLETGRSENK